MSTHGGARKGAGRKKGAKTKLTEEAIEKAAANGELPLDYMLRVMRDQSQDDKRRDAMAAAAAPFVHAKLAAMDVNATVSVSHEDALDDLDD